MADEENFRKSVEKSFNKIIKQNKSTESSEEKRRREEQKILKELSETKNNNDSAPWLSKLGGSNLLYSGDNSGFFLFIFGTLIHFLGYIFSWVFGYTFLMDSTLRLVFSVLFTLYTVFIIFRGKGLLTVLLAFVWYFWFGLSFNIAFLIVSFLILVFYGIIFKTDGLKQELIGLIPVIVFLLDIGLIPFIVDRFNMALTPLLTNLILFTPWWGLLGLKMTKEKEGDVLIPLFKFIALAYILLIVILGAVPNAGIQPKNIPQISDIIGAREDFEKQVNPVSEFKLSYYRSLCTLSYPAQPDLIEECVNEKKAKTMCKPYSEDKEEYDACRKKVLGKDVESQVDRKALDVTKIEFKKTEDFPSRIQRTLTPKLAVPYQIDLQSPSNVKLDLSCKFIHDNTEYAGEIEPKQLADDLRENGFSNKSSEIIFCKPRENYEKGHYQVVFEAKLDDVESHARLVRLFVGNTENDEKNELRRLHKLSSSEPSKSGESFAVFSFGLGVPSTNPFIDEKEIIPIIGAIENKQDGKISDVESIKVNLVPGLYLKGDCQFEYDGENLVWKKDNRYIKLNEINKGDKIPILNCYLEVDEDLRNLDYGNYQKHELESTIVYSYVLEEKQGFSVEGDIMEGITPNATA